MIDTLPALADLNWIIHGFSTRLGGVSEPPHASLNVGLSRPDNPHAVLVNRQIIATALGFSLDDVVMAGQIHGTKVTRVSAEQRGSGAYAIGTVLPAADALITNEPGVVLWAGFADCTPLIFVDAVERAVGVAHAGWQGTVGDIAGATVAALQREFGSQPANLLVAIGPSIGPCCYEVDQPVISRVQATFGANAATMLPRLPGRQRPHFDLWAANAALLVRAGVLEQRIILSNTCTACHVERFFSHRAEQGQTGRFATIISIRAAADPAVRSQRYA